MTPKWKCWKCSTVVCIVSSKKYLDVCKYLRSNGLKSTVKCFQNTLERSILVGSTITVKHRGCYSTGILKNAVYWRHKEDSKDFTQKVWLRLTTLMSLYWLSYFHSFPLARRYFWLLWPNSNIYACCYIDLKLHDKTYVVGFYSSAPWPQFCLFIDVKFPRKVTESTVDPNSTVNGCRYPIGTTAKTGKIFSID